MKTILLILSCCVLMGFTACKKDKAQQPANNNTQPSGDTTANNSLSNHKTQNLIIVTMDGFRWEEVFNGADSALLFNRSFNTEGQSVLSQRFWSSDLDKRRKELLPFFWNYIAGHGKLYGNRTLGNKVNVKNPYWISYPGYNEIFTGYPDPDIKSNDYGNNPNKNVLEFINEQTGFKNNVVAFSSLGTFFKRILNSDRSGVPVYGITPNKAAVKTSDGKTVMDHVKTLPLYAVNGDNSDYTAIVYSAAKTYLKKNHPRVLYMAFSLTDHYAHAQKYNCVLEVAHNISVMIGDLWSYIQSDPIYKDKTTLFICPDHGRGIGDDWTSHGSKLITAGHPHSDEIWFAVMGPDTKPDGEIKNDEQLFQNQFARTMAALLGFHFVNNHVIGNRIESVMDNDE